MPFLDHLEELRWRILWSLVAVLVGTVVGWWLLDKVDIIEVLKRPIAPYLPGGRLVFTSPAEPFMLTLKVAFALGCLAASPVVIYQIWAFLAPALYEREKRLIIPALAVGVVLFLAGAIACYQWLLPAALKVLLGFRRTDLTAMITIDRYFGMAVPFVVGCGLIAELPLVVTILAALGIVTPQFLGRQRRYAIVIAAFLAAILTPPDAVSMMLMLGPLLLLYELSIWCAWVASRRRARRVAAATMVLIVLGIGSLRAQNPPRPPLPPPRPPAAAPQGGARDTAAVARPPGTMDSATARKAGLPTAPSRSFPPSDAVMDSLLKLQGFRITHYMSDTFLVVGDSQTIFLRKEAFVDREGTQLQADSIRYHEASCRLDAAGDPQLFDQGTVLVGEGMRYDTCLRRGTVRDALTDFQQGGVYVGSAARAGLPFRCWEGQMDQQEHHGGSAGGALCPRRPHHVAAIHLLGHSGRPAERDSVPAFRHQRSRPSHAPLRAAPLRLRLLLRAQRLCRRTDLGGLVRRPECVGAQPGAVPMARSLHERTAHLHAHVRAR